jgi:hypothetical protein
MFRTREDPRKLPVECGQCAQELDGGGVAHVLDLFRPYSSTGKKCGHHSLERIPGNLSEAVPLRSFTSFFLLKSANPLPKNTTVLGKRHFVVPNFNWDF